MQTDPVCHMQVEPERAAARVEYKGETYYFCSQGCHKTFAANPAKYVGPASPAAAPGAGHPHHG